MHYGNMLTSHTVKHANGHRKHVVDILHEKVKAVDMNSIGVYVLSVGNYKDKLGTL